MLPDYFIYDELQRQDEINEADRHRPHLEVPRYMPYWPEPERDETPEQDEDRERGAIIIQM